ncbi:MAG: peptidylprolyl isomerase [Phycisphaerales bacterium JB060]
MGLHRAALVNRMALFAAIAAVILTLAHRADAQITADRTYYGIDREIPVTVSLPGRQDDGEAEASVVLFNGRGDRVAQASVLAGRVDLATFFPILWDQQDPIVLYAQLYSPGGGDGQGETGEPIGPPLVLQPLVTPQRATASSNGVRWQVAGPKVFSGLRVYVDKFLKLNTTEGPMVFRLRPDVAPNTVWHIRELARGGFYTDIPFHRVLPTHRTGKPFVVQAGDPTGSGTGGPGVFIDLEPSDLEHSFGVLSMARTNDPDTNGSQFFIALSREATAHLNGVYTAFGQAVSGAEAIIAVEQTPLADPRLGSPVEPPRIESAELIDAPPMGTGPEPIERPTGSGQR